MTNIAMKKITMLLIGQLNHLFRLGPSKNHGSGMTWAIPSDTWDEVERSGSDAAEFKPQRWMDMEVDSVTGCAKSR